MPDFIIVNRDGELELTLNSRNAPDLRINDQYKEMLINYKDSSRKQKGIESKKRPLCLSNKKLIRPSGSSMLSDNDQKKLRPMILKDVADITGLDISTVSRVANSKFVQTEFGTKRLKDFFSESLQTSDGEEVSTLEVKKILSEIIGEENKRKPLSDEKLKDMLQKKGYNIARRTVAKYREQLNIPVARLRKEL